MQEKLRSMASVLVYVQMSVRGRGVLKGANVLFLTV